GRKRRLDRIEPEQSRSRHRAIKLPAKPAEDVVAFAKVRIARMRHLADDPALHDSANLDRPGIGALATDTPAHIRVERQKDSTYQYLALAGSGRGASAISKSAGVGAPVGRRFSST